MSSAQIHFFLMSRALAAGGRHGRTMLPGNAIRASDGVIHSRIFILSVESSNVRKHILHIPQYQLNFRHLSSTAAVSTQNLNLAGFLPHPRFPGSARVTRHQKIRAERSSNLVPAGLRTWIPDVFSAPWMSVPSLRVLPSCLRSRLRSVQLVRCFPS